jgi:K+-sensing histidine kinase KdpD
MNRGADDYLPKPFKMADLLATVRARLRKQHVMRRQTEEKMEALRANISMALPHELRTPLSSIISGAEMIVNYGAGMAFEEIRELSNLIHRAGQRLSRLVENFLIYAQLEMLGRDAETAALLRQEYTYDPQAVLRRVAQAKAHEYGRVDDLTLLLADGPVAISERYLEKIAHEVLDNAFKYSEPGTPVGVEAFAERGAYRIRIRDEGYGMDANQRHAIGAYMQFERTLHEQQGTGLGLQIVRQLTHLHEGRFDLTSERKAGTTVEVALKTWVWASGATGSPADAASFDEGM